jgi:hypothetical protein
MSEKEKDGVMVHPEVLEQKTGENAPASEVAE